MRRSLNLLILCSLATLASLLAGPATAQAKVRVVTTVQTFRALAEEIGGDKVEVTALVGEAIDPHFVDPKPSYALTLNKADLLVHVGLDLERGWLPALVEQARNPKIRPGSPGNLEAARAGVTLLDVGGPVSRAAGDIHPAGNPHFWLSPWNGVKVARAIAARLQTIDPTNAAHYRERLRAFEARVAEKRKEWNAKARPLAGLKVVTYHKSWTYLTAWLGLREIGYVEPKPGVPPAPSHLAALVRTARAERGRLVLVESYYPRNTAQKVAELAGMKLVVLASDAAPGESYFAFVDRILAQLLGASR